MTTYKGVLTLHSETGTEGGHWAFQDEKFIGLPGPPHDRCLRCGRIWDHDRDNMPPEVEFLYWRADLNNTGRGGYHFQDTYDRDGHLGPTDFDQKVTRGRNDRSLECLNGHAEWEPMYPHGMWSYEGLHVLHDGDQLTIYYPDTRGVAWRGVVALTRFELFTEHASGWWIHADQQGVDRGTWSTMFFEEWPARLIAPN